MLPDDIGVRSGVHGDDSKEARKELRKAKARAYAVERRKREKALRDLLRQGAGGVQNNQADGVSPIPSEPIDQVNDCLPDLNKYRLSRFATPLLLDMPTDDRLLSPDRMIAFIARVRLSGDWELSARIAEIPIPAIRHRLEQGKIDFYQGERTWNEKLFRFVDQQAAKVQNSILLTIVIAAATKVRGVKKLTVEHTGDADLALAYVRTLKPSGGALRATTVNVNNNTVNAGAIVSGPPSKDLLEAYERITSDDLDRLKAKLEDAKARRDAINAAPTVPAPGV
jgi:hypothetical protein